MNYRSIIRGVSRSMCPANSSNKSTTTGTSKYIWKKNKNIDSEVYLKKILVAEVT
jgi:hypothetical protein